MEKEDLSRNFGFLLNDVARLMRTNFDRKVKIHNLTRSQWWVLNHLYRSDGCIQSELAKILDVEKQTLGKLLDLLEKKEWIMRKEDSKDRRAKRIFLTRKVNPIIKQMRLLAAETRKDCMLNIKQKDQDSFVNVLIKIKKNLS